MCVKEEMAKVMNFDQQLFKLDSDNTTLADKVSIVDKHDVINIGRTVPETN